MRNALQSAFTSYRHYRKAISANRTYRTVRYVVLSLVVAYIFLLSFPQVLFAHETSYKNFKVYSREPISQDMFTVLDKAATSLAASPIDDPALQPKVFLTGSHGLYATLSLFVGSGSFGKGFAMLPTSNIFINKSDAVQDLVFRNTQTNNQRSLSGAIAHETTHLLVRKKVGYLKNLSLPDWKKEGYSEYVAGGTTLDHETGMKLWRANPGDGTGYQYFKYYMLVKYLLDHEKLSVDELFSRDINVQSLEATVLRELSDDGL